jgi:hypothetical protein
MMKVLGVLVLVLAAAVGVRATEIIHPPGGGAPVEGTVLPAVQGGTGVDGQHTWTDGRCVQVGTDVDGKRILQTTAAACGSGGGGAFDPTQINDVTWGNNTDAAMTWTFDAAGANDPKLVARDFSLWLETTGPPLLGFNDLDIPNGPGRDAALWTNCAAGPSCQTVLEHAVNGATSIYFVADTDGVLYLGDSSLPLPSDQHVVLPNGAIGSAELTPTIAAGTCTNCTLTYDGSGRLTAAANGTGGSFTPATANDVTWGNNTDDGMLWTFDAAGTPDTTFHFFDGGMSFGGTDALHRFYFDSSVWFQGIGVENQGIFYDASTFTMAPAGMGILQANAYAGTLPIANGGTNTTGFTANRCVRFDGTRLVSAAADCGAGGGPTATASTPTPTVTATPTATATRSPTPTLTPTPQPTATLVEGYAIDLTAGVIDFDPTELTNFTVSDGTSATATTTYNLSGASDPTLTAENSGFTIGASSVPVFKMDDTHIANGANPDFVTLVACGVGPACAVTMNHAMTGGVSAGIFVAGSDGALTVGDASAPSLALQTSGTGTELACGGSGSNLCTVAADPTAALGIATKGYVDQRAGYTRLRYLNATARTSTTTLANDAGSGMNLVGFPVTTAAGLVYKLEAHLIVVSPVAAGFKVAIVAPAGSSCFLNATNLSATAATLSAATADCTTPGVMALSSFTPWDTIDISGFLLTGATGTVNLQWAQNVSNAGSTFLNAGSWMTLTAVREGDASFTGTKDVPDPWPPPPDPSVPTPAGGTP